MCRTFCVTSMAPVITSDIVVKVRPKFKCSTCGALTINQTAIATDWGPQNGYRIQK